MRKNGFTLVEMLTVIIIMVVLSLIAVFSISGVVKNSADRLYELQVTNIQDAARTYAVKNSVILSDNNEITICDLKRSSLLDKDLKDPRYDKKFDDSLIIKITKNEDGDYETIFDGTSKMENYYCDENVSVALNGASPLYVKIGDTHEELGVSVKRNNLECIHGSGTSDGTHCYYNFTKKGDYETILSGNEYSRVGTYKETYDITIDTFRSSITRTIVVQDKTAPNITVSYNGTNHNNSFSIRILEGTTANFSCTATDNNDSNISCKKQKDDYNLTTRPGTYEIIYVATDASGNSSTLIVNITVLAKNKNLIVGTSVSTTDWTSDPITLKIIPLYSNQNCSSYSYTFDGFFWNDIDTKVVTENGEYKMGIKCSNTEEADYMIYKVTNIDKTPPIFQGNTTIFANSAGNIQEVVKDGKSHYYSNSAVTISSPSGAVDSDSGVAGYETYVNGILSPNNTISGDGKYEIKVLAYDYANNRSEMVLAAYVIISTSKPTCEFLRCNSQADCNDKKPIDGLYVTYSNGYKLTSRNFPLVLDYKFTCSYEYYDGEEAIMSSASIPNDKFYLQEEVGDMNQITVNGVTNNSAIASTVCNDGRCVKTNSYVVSINAARFYNPTVLHITENALCDRIGNCNTQESLSMVLDPQ